MEDWKQSGIYMLTCRINGKRYIGQSKNVAKRVRSHKSNKHKYHNQIIKNAIAKYGWENFEVTILEFCSIDKLDELEIYYIAKYQSEYNIKEGVGRADHSIKTREVLRQSTKKQWQDTNIRKIIQKPVICLETGEIFESINTAAENVGIHRAGISMALNGKQKTAGGCHWEYLNKEDKVSEETSYNLGCANRGKKQSAEQIAKRVAHLKGKHRTNFGNYKSVICIETGEIFKSVKIAGEQIGVHQTLISKVLHGEKKTAGGYHWKLIEKETDKND